MALIDSIKGREVPKPTKGPQGNIPLNSPKGAGINQVPLSSRIIGGAKDVVPMGSPIGRHKESPVSIIKKSPLAGVK